MQVPDADVDGDNGDEALGTMSNGAVCTLSICRSRLL